MEGCFEVDGDRLTLIGGYSPSSGHHHFPLSPVCPYTGADDVERVALPRTGRLWAWTAVTSAPPGYGGPVPYGFGVVELDGVGLRVVGRLIEPDPSRLAEGDAMALVADRWQDEAIDTGGGDGGEFVVWAFARSGE